MSNKLNLIGAIPIPTHFKHLDENHKLLMLYLNHFFFLYWLSFSYKFKVIFAYLNFSQNFSMYSSD